MIAIELGEKIIKESDDLGTAKITIVCSFHIVDFIIDSTTMEIKYKDIIIKKINEVENIFVSKNLLNVEKADLKNLKYILPFEYTFTTKNLIDKLNKEGIVIDADMQIDITESRIKLAK